MTYATSSAKTSASVSLATRRRVSVTPGGLDGTDERRTSCEAGPSRDSASRFDSHVRHPAPAADAPGHRGAGHRAHQLDSVLAPSSRPRRASPGKQMRSSGPKWRSRQGAPAEARPTRPLRVRLMAESKRSRWLTRSVALAPVAMTPSVNVGHRSSTRRVSTRASRRTRLTPATRITASVCVAIVIASPTASTGGVTIRSTSHRFSSTANASATTLDSRNSPGSGGGSPAVRTSSLPAIGVESVAVYVDDVERVYQRDAQWRHR